MKVTSFHFMPYRELPDDVELRYRSMWVDAPWHELADAARTGDFYNQSIDELMLAAEVGFDGLGTNEHHQNPYGFMCNPNLFGAILARMTRDRGLDVALVQLGATLVSASPIRVAEEYAVLDCLSGGRLIAGVPAGIGADAGLSYGVTPIEQRSRWREGIEFMLRAWTSTEPFAWNGEHYQLRNVNLWPRPVQTPHPPLLVPEAEYGAHLEYFYKRLLHFPPQYFTPPGYLEYPSQLGAFRSMLASPPVDLKELSARDMIERGFAVVGSPATVRDRLEAIARRLGVGHLLAIMQFGSMPHELAERNIRLFGSEVLPHLRTIWNAEGWEDRWWPTGIPGTLDPAAVGSAA
jgi:alkanesulfonate monooxygenase SsuD/methylene tetrahydromethanopterin reductase-like flavin-dependent oxidoreductase (luciferase family)